MDSPELEANDVMREEFSGAGNIWGFGIFVRSMEDRKRTITNLDD